MYIQLVVDTKCDPLGTWGISNNYPRKPIALPGVYACHQCECQKKQTPESVHVRLCYVSCRSYIPIMSFRWLSLPKCPILVDLVSRLQDRQSPVITDICCMRPGSIVSSLSSASVLASSVLGNRRQDFVPDVQICSWRCRGGAERCIVIWENHRPGLCA
jgi:hypothetical protein